SSPIGHSYPEPCAARLAARSRGEPETAPVRSPEMRLKVALPLLVCLAGLASAGGEARAAHCGASGYPAQCCAPEQCCMPTVRYRVCYRTVVEEQTQTCYRPVYRTVMK